jgi:hypothetical protein
MKRYKRFEESTKIINCKIGSKIYEIDLIENIKEYKDLFGTNLTQINKVFGKQLKQKGGPDKAEYSFSGIIDITIEGLLSTAYQLTGDKIFKDLNELIQTIFGKVEGSFDYWVDVEDYLNTDIDIDFTFLYNQELKIKIDIR